MNLLQKAWQYTLTGGTVRVSAERSPESIRLTCSNTAGEIVEEDLPFIFERFYRGEKSRSRQRGGRAVAWLVYPRTAYTDLTGLWCKVLTSLIQGQELYVWPHPALPWEEAHGYAETGGVRPASFRPSARRAGRD
jgi:hypothetical protein